MIGQMLSALEPLQLIPVRTVCYIVTPALRDVETDLSLDRWVERICSVARKVLDERPCS